MAVDVGVGVGVELGVGVEVGVDERVDVGVAVGVGEGVGDGVDVVVGVVLGAGGAVSVAMTVADSVGSNVGVRASVGPGVTRTVGRATTSVGGGVTVIAVSHAVTTTSAMTTPKTHENRVTPTSNECLTVGRSVARESYACEPVHEEIVHETARTWSRFCFEDLCGTSLVQFRRDYWGMPLQIGTAPNMHSCHGR